MRLDPFALVAAVCFWGFLPWAQRLDPDLPRWFCRLAWCFLVTGPVLAVAGPGLGSALLASPAVIFAVWLLVHGVRRFLATDQAALSLRLLGMLAAAGPLVAAAAWEVACRGGASSGGRHCCCLDRCPLQLGWCSPGGAYHRMDAARSRGTRVVRRQAGMWGGEAPRRARATRRQSGPERGGSRRTGEQPSGR